MNQCSKFFFSFLAAEKHENVQLVFNHKLTDMDADSGWMTLMDNTTGRSFKSYADLIIGCDGLHSTVRRMIMDTPGFNLTQVFSIKT